MIQKKSYTFLSDFWQLGIVLYELIYEKLPFANHLDDPI
jgi:serine/threonine protein kinase